MEPLVFAEINLNGLPSRTRKSHTKSRFGCDNCKVRRIKCDEQTPTCGDCLKRGKVCKRSRLRNGATRNGEHDNPQSSPSSGGRTLNMVDLRLLHHFESHTSKTIMLHSVTEDVIEQAMDDEVLMRAILMISAAHMLFLNKEPSRRHQYREAELTHLAYVTAALRVAVSNMTKDNVNVIFMASLLLYNQTWCWYEDEDNHDIPGETDSDSDSGIESLDPMVSIGSGLKKMVMGTNCWRWASKSRPFKSMIKFSPKVLLMSQANEIGGEDAVNRFAAGLLETFTTRHSDCESFDICVKEFKRLFIPYIILNLVKQGLMSLEDEALESCLSRYFFTWPVLLSAEFVALAQKDDLCTRVVLFYYFSALRDAMEDENGQIRDKYWWAGNRVQRRLPNMGRRLRKEGVEALDLLNMQRCISQMEEF